MAKSGEVTLITFYGTSILVNGFVGVALRFSKDLDLTENKIKILAKLAGVVAGAGVRIGTYVIKCKLSSNKVETFELVVQGIQGGLEGFLVAKVQCNSIRSNLSKGSLKIELGQKVNFDDYDQPSAFQQKSFISKFFSGSDTFQELDPKDIRYSQTTVNYQSRNGTNFSELVTSMDTVGYNGNPIHVVKMPDGLYTSMDNRRVLSADLTSNKVKAIVHDFKDIFKEEKTWGEAILERIRQQNCEEFNRGYGSFDRPDVVVSNSNYDALIDMLLNVARIGSLICITVHL
jgi:hypothetical protein